MTSSLRRALLAAAAVAALASACGENTDPATDVFAPDSVRARPLSMTSAQVDWVAGQSVTGAPFQFVIERRADFDGPWTRIPASEMPEPRIGPNSFVDNGLAPDTYYGYRVRAVDQTGEASPFSPILGVRTPPRPGVRVIASSSGNVTDPDGYLVTLTSADGLDSVRRLNLAPRGQVLFQPLRPGSYTVTLSDIFSFCRLGADSVRTVDVTDLGLSTVDTVAYDVTCRDPNRASLTAAVAVTGPGSDDDGFEVLLEGIVGDSAVSQRRGVGGTGGTAFFDNLLPGDYQVKLEGISPNCTLAGETTRRRQLAAGEEADESFAVECGRPGQDTTAAGYRLRGTWSPIAAGATAYTLTLDLSTFDDPAIPGADDVLAISGLLAYDQTKLTFTTSANVAGSRLQNQSTNEVQPGLVAWLNFDTDAARATGQVGVVVLRFTVNAGATGTVQPVTSFQSVDEIQSENGTDLKPRIVIIDRDLSLSGGGGATPPTAEANGPYTGAVGASIAFSSAGSLAAPGRTIVSYSWAFSDGQTLTGASPTRSFTAAGAYTVTLTVTDDQGATDTDEATITVTGGTPPPGNQYVLRGAWSGTGASRTYTLTLDLTGRDDPAIPGADDVFVISGTTRFAGLAASGLTYASSSNVAGSRLQNQGANDVTQPGTPSGARDIAWLNFDTDVARATGVVGVINLNFAGTPSGTVTPTTSFGPTDDVVSENGVNLLPNTRLEEAVLGGGGGGGPTPPTAEANGPYSGQAGATIAFSSAGSAAAAGRTIVSYAWAFSDGQTLTGASPSRTFATAGSYTVTLTVTDDQGLTGTDQASITVTAPPASGVVWRNTFGAPGADNIVTLTVAADLRSDLPETPGPEALARVLVDSLTWDPTVLQYRGFSVPTGNAYTVLANSGAGRLQITRGEIAPANSTGLVTIIEVRFLVVGTAGRSTTTRTGIGQLQGTAAVNNFDYRPRTTVTEGTFTVP